MVAPSFQNFTKKSEPFCKDGRMYIAVENPKTGNERIVRWYTDAEYAKAYGKSKKAAPSAPVETKKKEITGETEGLYVIANVDTPEDEKWCRRNAAWWNKHLGWFFRPWYAMPKEVPAHFNVVELTADECKDKTFEELSWLAAEKARRKVA